MVQPNFNVVSTLKPQPYFNQVSTSYQCCVNVGTATSCQYNFQIQPYVNIDV